MYSRVARVCKWDKGGPHRFRNRWTTYLKSRLNCSIPGEFPFYFNEIREFFCESFSEVTRANSSWHSLESSSELVEGAYGNTNSRLIYGVFSTPNNAIAGSAICAFSLQVWQRRTTTMTLLPFQRTRSDFMPLFFHAIAMREIKAASSTNHVTTEKAFSEAMNIWNDSITMLSFLHQSRKSIVQFYFYINFHYKNFSPLFHSTSSERH